MSRALTNRGKLQAVAESAFGADPGSGYVDVSADEGLSIAVKRLMLEDPTMRARSHALARLAVGDGTAPFPVEDGAEIVVTMPYHGFSSTIPTAAPTTGNPLMDFAVAALGAKWAAGYDADGIDTGSTTSVLKAKDLSGYRAGQLLAIISGGTYSARFAKLMDETTTPQEATLPTGMLFHGAPVADSTLWGSFCAVHSDTFSSDAKSYTFVYHMPSGQASPAARKRTFVGCRPKSVRINLPLRGRPTVQYAFAVAGEMALANTTLTDLSYDYPAPTSFTSSYCYLSDGTTGYGIDPSSLVIDYNNNLIAIGDPNYSASTTGIKEWQKGVVTCTAQFNPYFDEDLLGFRWDQDLIDLATVLGHQPGRFCGIRMAGGRVPAVEDEDRDGLKAHGVTLEMNLYSGDVHDDGVSGRTDGTVDSLFTMAWA